MPTSDRTATTDSSTTTAPTPVVPEREDTRTDPPFLGAERAMLESWLELYRETVPLKLAGLTAEQLAEQSVPPSTLSLLGVLRHLSEVERYWLTDVLLGEDSPDLYSTRESPDGCFTEATAATAAADVATYDTELDQARRNAARVADLDAPVAGRRRGNEVNLRWIYVHLVEEYARHLGHMDLLREAIDGRAGY